MLAHLGAPDIKLARHARYFGIQIGPEGWQRARDTALRKYHQRCIETRRLRIGLAMSMRMH
eukprot:4791204-Pyramimonas_sp.AAC.1